MESVSILNALFMLSVWVFIFGYLGYTTIKAWQSCRQDLTLPEFCRCYAPVVVIPIGAITTLGFWFMTAYWLMTCALALLGAFVWWQYRMVMCFSDRTNQAEPKW